MRHNLRNLLFRADIKVVAIRTDGDFAGTGAIFCELFGGVVFFGLLVAADEEDGEFDSLGVLD